MISLLAIFTTYIIGAAITSYIVTVVLVKGHLFTYLRCAFRIRTLWLIKGPPGDRRHLIDCRLCTGAWVSVTITAIAIALLWLACWWLELSWGIIFIGIAVLMMSFPVVWGGSYFLATQERE